MNVAIAILIMFLVSYLPRALPISFINKKINNRFIRSFLFYVPYAVIAALTFPGIFFVTANIYLSLIGTLTAIVLSFFNLKMYLVAIISVVVMFGVSFIFY